LPNRLLLADRFIQRVNRGRRNNSQVAFLILDLNRFKLINDSLGHQTGDKVLVEIGKRLHAIARSSDTVCRYGGDEFVFLLSDIEQLSAVIDVVQRIAQTVAQPLLLDNQELQVSCSIGAAIWPQDGETLASLLSHADAALYQAKGETGEYFRFYTREINAQVQQCMTLENDLRRAMANTLNMKVIAEGVENQDQVAFLKQCGCQEMQGYLISRPLPANQFEELMEAYQPLPA
jgi:diguanylate cyclase (GGDEF)-like protein